MKVKIIKNKDELTQEEILKLRENFKPFVDKIKAAQERMKQVKGETKK